MVEFVFGIGEKPKVSGDQCIKISKLRPMSLVCNEKRKGIGHQKCTTALDSQGLRTRID